MAYNYITQLFTDGMNKDIDPAVLDLSMQNQTITLVADSANMVFERGLCTTRYGIIQVAGAAPLPSTHNLRAVKLIPVAAQSRNNPIQDRGGFAYTDEPKLYTLESFAATAPIFNPVEVTGPGLIPWGSFYIDSAVANGVVLIAGATGLVRWDPTTTVYTILANSAYQYVTGHLSRAVAAFGTTPITGPSTVAWSVPGDETRWGSANFLAGAGINILADCYDSITGIKVAKGVVVLARAFGFHLGIPTGQSPAVYDWRKVSDMSVGCMHPATFCVYRDTCFFMSDCGIHMFDLVEVTDIGEGIYNEINGFIRQYGLVARGFVASSYGPDFQPTYNIFLDTEGPENPNPERILPHYMYNLREKKWTRHFYEDSTHTTNAWSPLGLSMQYTPANYTDGGSISSLAVYRRYPGAGSVPLQWTQGAPIESGTGSFVITGQITLSDPSQDMQVDRILLIYKAPPVSPSGQQISIQVNWILNGVPQTQTLLLQTYPAGGWDRRWINFRATGNMFQAKIIMAQTTVTPQSIKALVWEYTPVGKVRT